MERKKGKPRQDKTEYDGCLVQLIEICCRFGCQLPRSESEQENMIGDRFEISVR